MTASELFALPSNDRVDRRLIRGRLIERPYPFRSPAYAAVVANLCGLLGNWAGNESGRGYSAYGYGCPYRIHQDPDSLVYFDASVISEDLEKATPRICDFIEGQPLLAIEVVDQVDPKEAVTELVDVSTELGIPIFVLIDAFAETIDTHRPGQRAKRSVPGDELDLGDIVPGFRCEVSEIFE